MNYIEAELRRQQILLSRLLLGVPAEAGTEKDAFSQQRPDGDVRGLPSVGPATSGAGEAFSYNYEAPRPATAASARAAESLGASSLSAAPSCRAALSAAEGGSNLRRAVGGPGGVPGGIGEYFPTGGNAPGGQGVVLLPAAGPATPSGEQDAARTVSLWAERDARRYDGGYTMY